MMKHDKLLVVWILNAFLVVLLTACGGSQGSGESTNSSQTGGQSSGGSSLVGTWSGNCAALNIANHIEFRDGGTVVANNVVGTYSVNGNQIQLSANGYTVEYSYTLSQSGNILNLSDVNGNFCSLGRVGSNAAQETAQSLIGVWTTGQSCEGVESAFMGFSKIDIKSDQTANVYTPSYDSDHYTETYVVSDAGTVVFRDNLGNQDTFAVWVSGNTLQMEENGEGPKYPSCTFQKSA